MPETSGGGAGRAVRSNIPLTQLTRWSCLSNPNDGTSIYQHGGKTELIETATGRSHWTIEDGSNFSTISGRYTLPGARMIATGATSQIDMALVNTNVRVPFIRPVCRQYLPGGANTLPLYPPSGSADYSIFLHYTCYMGAGWWGNITPWSGLMAVIGSASAIQNISQSVTLPCPGAPILSALRNYRGYTSASYHDSHQFVL